MILFIGSAPKLQHRITLQTFSSSKFPKQDFTRETIQLICRDRAFKIIEGVLHDECQSLEVSDLLLVSVELKVEFS